MAVIKSGKVALLRGEDMMADQGYKERLAHFMQTVNPKPTLETIEQYKAKIEADRQESIRRQQEGLAEALSY